MIGGSISIGTVIMACLIGFFVQLIFKTFKFDIEKIHNNKYYLLNVSKSHVLYPFYVLATLFIAFFKSCVFLSLWVQRYAGSNRIKPSTSFLYFTAY